MLGAQGGCSSVHVYSLEIRAAMNDCISVGDGKEAVLAAAE